MRNYLERMIHQNLNAQLKKKTKKRILVDSPSDYQLSTSILEWINQKKSTLDS